MHACIDITLKGNPNAPEPDEEGKGVLGLGAGEEGHDPGQRVGQKHGQHVLCCVGVGEGVGPTRHDKWTNQHRPDTYQHTSVYTYLEHADVKAQGLAQRGQRLIEARHLHNINSSSMCVYICGVVCVESDVVCNFGDRPTRST